MYNNKLIKVSSTKTHVVDLFSDACVENILWVIWSYCII